MSDARPVHLAVAPPDGFEGWTPPEWDAWLAEHPWEPSEVLADRGHWLIFLYQCRVHAPGAMDALSPFLERLMNERPIPSREASALLAAFDEAASALSKAPASKLWTGTQFYSADELHALIVEAEARTGRKGLELRIVDLWSELFLRLDAVVVRALAEGRGVWFGDV